MAKEEVPLGKVATVDGRGPKSRNAQFAHPAVGRASMQSGLFLFIDSDRISERSVGSILGVPINTEYINVGALNSIHDDVWHLKRRPLQRPAHNSDMADPGPFAEISDSFRNPVYRVLSRRGFTPGDVVANSLDIMNRLSGEAQFHSARPNTELISFTLANSPWSADVVAISTPPI